MFLNSLQINYYYNKDQIYRRGILPSGKFKKLRSYHQTWRGTLNPRVLALHHSQMSKFNTMCATASYLHFQEKDCCKFSVKNRDLSIQYLLFKVVANIKRQKWLLFFLVVSAFCTKGIFGFVILWSETISDNLKSKPTWVTPQARPMIRRLWMSVISVIEDWQHGARRQSSCWAQGLISRNLLPITAKD